MTSPFTIPANFGIELLKLKSNNVTLVSDDGPIQASAVILSLNSPVIKKRMLEEDQTELSFYGYSAESVKLFLKTCYQGRLDTSDKKNMSHLHKISHVYQVYWITEALLEEYRSRVHRCTQHTYGFETALFLFKEAASTLLVLKKQTFVDVFIQSFAGVPERREEFLKLYLKNLHKYSAEELKIAVELSGGRVDIVVNALANHILEFKRLDTNARGLLKNIKFSYLETEHPQAYKALFDVLVDNIKYLENEDAAMILKLRHGVSLGDPLAWDRNITLANLFHTRVEDDSEDVEFGDSLSESVGSSLSLNDRPIIQLSSSDSDEDTPTTSRVCSSDDGSAAYFSSREDEESQDELQQSEAPQDSEESRNETDSDEQGSEESANSSNEDTRDAAGFKNRMLKLMANENGCNNLYMFIEDLWDWILRQGNSRLDIDFPETMSTVKKIKTHRGWFPISPDFVDRLVNISQNQNVARFKEAIKNTSSLISDDNNFRISSRGNYSMNSILQGTEEAIVAFEFRHKAIKVCTQKGICGFLFKLILGHDDDFKMELGYSKSDHKDRRSQDPLNLDFHDNLMFAQRMHIMVTGFKGTNWSLPLSWEGKPTFDDNKNIVSWGRHKFKVNGPSGSDSSQGSSIESSPEGLNSRQGTIAGNSSELYTDLVYNWGVQDEVRFEVYYCTA